MYKAVIIDDEQTVREGIQILLPWEDIGFTIIAEASNGEDGLEAVLNYQPEVVLVDVRMPGMTGLELISEARKAGYKGDFLILSGYSDFKYAKSAIRLGVKGYLLKPIDEEELLKYICDIRMELDQKQKEKEKAELLQSEKKKNHVKARQNIIYNLLMKQETIEVIEREIDKFGFDYSYNKFYVIVLNNDRFYMEEDYKEKIKLILFGLSRCEYLVLGDRIAIIIKGDNLQKDMEQLIENNRRMKARYEDDFFVAVGQKVVCLKDICFSYECAQYLIERKFLFRKMNMISMDLLSKQFENLKNNSHLELSDCIEIGDIVGIVDIVHCISSQCRYKLMKESHIKVMTINNAILLINNLKTRYIGHSDKLMDINSFTEEVNKAETIEEMELLVIEHFKKVSDKLGNTGADNIVKRMEVFIQKNYNKDLKLETIAKMFGYNSAYLGKTYKKSSGESFNTTLDKVRITNAKELLQNTNLKVYQVSEKVGYYNIDYFYSKFKKYVGMTPK
ncbi:response regulator, partial [Anaerosporobacter sp.]